MGSEALLPVLVFSDELKPGTPEWDSVRPRVQQAFKEYGGFEALFNKIPCELRKSMLGEIEKMFELPLQTKSKIVSAKAPLGTVYTARSTKAPWESMDVEDVLIPEKLSGFINLLWPEGNPSFGKTVQFFSETLSEMDQMIRRMVLESFGVEKYCDEHIDSSLHTFRVMKYEGPKTMDNKLMLFSHTDKNLLSILYQINQVGGLEVQSKDGKWVNMKSSVDSFIVMAGDSFHAWTNGRVKALPHRVVMTGNETRYSVGLFSSSKEGHIIRAPDELVDKEHPLRFKPYEFSEYQKFFKTEEGRKIHEYGTKDKGAKKKGKSSYPTHKIRNIKTVDGLEVGPTHGSRFGPSKATLVLSLNEWA